MDNPDLLPLTATIVTAYLSGNRTMPADLPDLIRGVHGALANLEPPVEPPLKPAVTLKKSVTPSHIICLEDGERFKIIKRHLRVVHDLSPAEYRQKWGLAANYPMVAPV